MKHVFNHSAACCMALALTFGPGCHAADGSATPTRTGLVYHEVASDGTVTDSHEPDRPFNPASVLKVATTLLALKTLGPEHRFVTRFGYRGTLDRSTGVLSGDLLVAGGVDPDFHVENARMVAAELNRLGIREVQGDVQIDDRFWIGWEGGSEKRLRDPDARATQMARRLRVALDPRRWSTATRKGVNEFRRRRGLPAGPLPAVTVTGEARRGELAPDAVTWLVEHRSNPTLLTLKRFNAYSNNDIERFGVSIGSTDAVERLLVELGLDASRVAVGTLSGLGVNRLSARAVVRLLAALAATCADLGVSTGDVLPVLGCDPGTLDNFTRLDEEAYRGSLVAKTGSLNETDGGVAVLAGILATTSGQRMFCVASPGAGGRLPAARAAQESWLLDRIAAAGGATSGTCPAALPYSDTDATVAAVRDGDHASR